MTRVYELELKAKHSISPNLISELELDAAAADLLKQANKRGFSVKAGDLYPAQTEKVNRQGQHGQGNYIVEEPASEFWADEVVGIDELIQDTQGRELTANALIGTAQTVLWVKTGQLQVLSTENGTTDF